MKLEFQTAVQPAVPQRTKVRYADPLIRIQPLLVVHEAPDIRAPYNVQVNGPEDVARLLVDSIGKMEQEVFVVLGLSSRNWVIGIRVVTVGILNATLVHAREVYRAAITMNAAAIIVAHNHPSGDPTPSREDLKITGDLVQAGRVVGIKLLDHVVIGRKLSMDPRYFCSIKESGLVLFED